MTSRRWILQAILAGLGTTEFETTETKAMNTLPVAAPIDIESAGKGGDVTLVEGQVVAMVVEEPRSQVQLVIGYAVTLPDLHDFLQSQSITT